MRKPVLLAGALLALACTDEDFNRPELLDQPRILAIKAEPPDVRFGTTTTLQALVYVPPAEREGDCPNPGAPPTYQWSWCPFPTTANNRHECLVTQAEFDALYASLGLGTAPSFDLGSEPTATFTNPFPAPFLYALCRGDMEFLPGFGGQSTPDGGTGESPFYCDLPAGEKHGAESDKTNHPISFPLSIKLEVTPACPSSKRPAEFEQKLMAVYNLHLPTNDAIPVNQNPVLGKISILDPMTGNAPMGDAAGPDAESVPAVDAEGTTGAVDAESTPGLDGGQAPSPLDGGNAGVDADALDGGVPMADSPIDGGVAAAQDAREPIPASIDVVGIPLDELGRSPAIARQKHVPIRINVSIDSSEYMPQPTSLDVVIDKNGKITDVIYFERLSFVWFAEEGDFGADFKGGRRYAYAPEPNRADPTVRAESENDPAFQDAINNFWTLPRKRDYGYDTARIIVVVRDGRGGIDWATGVANLESTP